MTSFDVLVSLHTHGPGQLLLRRHLDPEPSVTVVEASHDILVSDAMLSCAIRGDHFALPGVRLAEPPHPNAVGWAGWFLHVDADKHVVYKIGTYDHTLKAWSAAWPD